MVGEDGVMVVDTQFAPLSSKILTAIRSISDKPIRYVVNTHMHGDHIGGNEAIAKAGRTRAGGNVVGDIGADATATAKIIAHENVLLRLSMPSAGAKVPFGNLPTETYVGRKREMRFNGEAVQISPKRIPMGIASCSSEAPMSLPPGICSRRSCTPSSTKPTAARSTAISMRSTLSLIWQCSAT
jgi:hypothetical protein